MGKEEPKRESCKHPEIREAEGGRCSAEQILRCHGKKEEDSAEDAKNGDTKE